MNVLDKIGEEKMLSIIKDPFGKKFVQSVTVSYQQSMYSNDWYAYGRVKFINGNTTGEQKFDGESFDDVVIQIKAFIEQLEKN